MNKQTTIEAATAHVPSLMASDDEWAAYQARCDALDRAFKLRERFPYEAAADAIEADYALLAPLAFVDKYEVPQ